MNLQIISLFSGFSILSIVFFKKQSSLFWWSQIYQCVFFMCHDFSVISKILVSISTGLFLLNSRLQRLFLMISSNFYSLIFHFRPMISLKLIFEHAIRAKSPFFPIRGYPIISIICWKDYLFKLMLLVRFVESDLDI